MCVSLQHPAESFASSAAIQMPVATRQALGGTQPAVAAAHVAASAIWAASAAARRSPQRSPAPAEPHPYAYHSHENGSVVSQRLPSPPGGGCAFTSVLQPIANAPATTT